MQTILKLQAGECNEGTRVDAFLAEKIDGLSRNAIQKLIESGKVLNNGAVIKKNYKLSGTEILQVEISPAEKVEMTPENIPIDIVYEDDDIIVVNKHRGMVVHPAVGNWSGTLVNALMYHCGDRLSGINGKIRPGIVHRIDKDTSGLIVVAKNDLAHRELALQIFRHAVTREYQAIIHGSMNNDSGTINSPISRHSVDRKKMAVIKDGRPAITHYKVINRFQGYSHMQFQLETGRTHQIRVHMASQGHPIIGDPLYGVLKGRFSNIGGQCLHASHLELIHPRTKESMDFDAAIPDYFVNILKKLN